MEYHGTTIIAVRHKGKVAVAGDGQVTLNTNVVKHHAKKVRRIYKSHKLMLYLSKYGLDITIA